MSELTDRYVGATLRSIPEKQRADIEAELRASIADEIEARTMSGEDATEAEEQVLTALGDPDRLAADYTGRPGYLIGPDLFFDYKRLLTVLLVTVVPIVAVVVGVVDAIGGADVGSVAASAVSTVFSLVVHIVFWTTVVFVVIERTGAKSEVRDAFPSPTNRWKLSSLPPMAPAANQIKLGDTIGSVVGLVIAIVGLVMSRDFLGVTADDGSLISFFEPVMYDFWIPFLIVMLALEVIFELVKYRMGRWTWTLASVNLALNVGSAVPTIYLLATNQLINPLFFDELGWSVPQWGDTAITITVIVIVVVSGWSLIDGFRKAKR